MKPLYRVYRGLLLLCLSLGPILGMAGCAQADTRVSLHLSSHPDLVPVPGYPVYYAPHLSANFFFYEGDYWLLEDGGWYRSDWYDGPWMYVEPDFVPLYVLRVPVRYYRAPPPYFRGWYHDAPPRWGYYWGPTWERRHHGWDRWDRRHVPALAPLPNYRHRPGYRSDRDNWYGHRDNDHRRGNDRRHDYPNRYERPDSRSGWNVHGDRSGANRREPGGQEPRRDERHHPITPRMPVPQRMPAVEPNPSVPRYAPPRQVPSVDGSRGFDRGEQRGWQRGNDHQQPPRPQQIQQQMRDRSDNPRGQFHGRGGQDNGRGGQQGRDR